MASLSVMLLKILTAVHATCDAHAFPLPLSLAHKQERVQNGLRRE